MKASLSDTITISPNLRFSEIAGEIVVLNLESETFFSLDEVGTHIWRLLQQHSNLGNVYEILREEFDVGPNRLEYDLLQHISELVDAGLVTIGTRNVAAC